MQPSRWLKIGAIRMDKSCEFRGDPFIHSATFRTCTRVALLMTLVLPLTKTRPPIHMERTF